MDVSARSQALGDVDGKGERDNPRFSSSCFRLMPSVTLRPALSRVARCEISTLASPASKALPPDTVALRKFMRGVPMKPATKAL
ncbi:MAG: hypothetical protein E5W89_30175 [Mesorhizobium sp.]|nr:hypothetical protein [Mesorhizobium sp.]TIS86162.1 MAG: hypothetical protein E5W89_30175 [Mesorhizobium sp.]